MSLECAKVVDAIASGVRLDGEFLQEHGADCAECACRIALAEQIRPSLVLASPGAEMSEPAAELLGELRSGIRKQLGALGRWRSLVPNVRGAVLGVLAVLLVLSQIFNARGDLHVYPLERMGVVLAAFALSLIVAWACAFRSLYRRSLPHLYVWALGVLVLVVHVVVAVLPEAHTGHGASVGGTGAELIPRALACFLYGTVFSVPVLVAGIASMRTGTRLPVLLLVEMIAAASIGNAVLQLHCPLTSPAHLLAGHATIGIFFALFAGGWIALRR